MALRLQGSEGWVIGEQDKGRTLKARRIERVGFCHYVRVVQQGKICDKDAKLELIVAEVANI